MKYVLVLFCSLAFNCFSQDSQDGEADTFGIVTGSNHSGFRYEVAGTVVNEDGEPLWGVEYFITNRYGKGGARGPHHTGIVAKSITLKDGKFSCWYSGEGWEGEAISVAFYHRDYAPAWLIRKSDQDGDLTVRLDKGVELKGIVAPKGERVDSDPGTLMQWPLNVRLDYFHLELGGWLSRILQKTDPKGRFSFRIPKEYWTCGYTVYFAGQGIPLKLEKGAPLPFLRLDSRVSMSLEYEK